MHQESDDDQMLNHLHFTKRDEIKMVLSSTAQKIVTQLTKNSEYSCLLNNHLDLYNKAQPEVCSIDVAHNVEFQHYFVKHKNRDVRKKVFDQIRNLLIQRGYNQISQINDRQQEQIMVVRVTEKVENSINTFIIQDQFSKQKIVVKQGFMWIGMICAVKARWLSSGTYHLQRVIDLSMPINQKQATFSANMTVNRVMFVKGPFRAKFSNQDTGIRMITNQIKKLLKMNIRINSLVVMGPILSKINKSVENFTLQRTYEQQYQHILATLKTQIANINNQIKIFILPSLDDIVSLHPIPQPAYNSRDTDDRKVKLKNLSNPSSLRFEGRRAPYKIDLINYDILKWIQTHKAGIKTKQLRQQLLETYMKQPFFMTNTANANEPFDELNLSQLYNMGNFGDIVVFSSTFRQPLVNQINGRVIVDIGALGVDYHYLGKNYMVVMSIFQGEGPISQRVKIQSIQYQ